MNDQVKVGDKIVVTTAIYHPTCPRHTVCDVVSILDGGIDVRVSYDGRLWFFRDGEYLKMNDTPTKRRNAKPVVAEKLLKNGEYGKMNATKRRNAKPGAPAVLHDARVVRDGEQIGGGFFVFRRGSKTGRVRTPEWPFEHSTLDAAQAEAARLTAKHAGETFEVFGREDK